MFEKVTERLEAHQRRSEDLGRRRARLALAIDPDAAGAELERDEEQLTADMRKTAKEVKGYVGGKARLMAKIELGFIVLVAIAGEIFFDVSLPFRADFYFATATIAPVLLVAGFVEVKGAWNGLGGSWLILAFSAPAVLSGAAALGALVSARAGPTTFFFSAWGLASATAVLLINACFNAESRPRDKATLR